jgi:hypothetical protein
MGAKGGSATEEAMENMVLVSSEHVMVAMSGGDAGTLAVVPVCKPCWYCSK